MLNLLPPSLPPAPPHPTQIRETSPAERRAIERATALVAKMTTEEKVAQLIMEAPAIPRLGVAKYHWWSEALHGVAWNGIATVFPQAIGLAATWDPEGMQRVATAISIEARAKNNHDENPGAWYHGLTLWSPNINIFRDPRWGRGQETYGEDPFLTSRMGVSFVRGIQGDDPEWLRCVATPKHFAVHSGPEPLRHGFDAKAPQRDLYETYFPAFEATVKEGRASSVMSAYSGFNGQYCTGSPWLLTTLLRQKWGFTGAVVSDVDSVKDLQVGHHVAKDEAEAAAMALKAGCDLNGGYTYRALPEALKRGLITEADLDRAAIRLFTLRYRLGMFDKNAYGEIPLSEVDSPTHDALNFETAKKSLVLLKNDGTLPLSKSIRSVAVIGPVADEIGTLIGNYPGTPSHPVTILAGLRKRGVKINYAYGCQLAEGVDVGRDPLPSGSVTSNGAPGWTRELYRDKEFKEKIATDRVDKADLYWRQGLNSDLPFTFDYSVVWSGTFTPSESGEATFGVSADDGVRVYIDGKLVVDDWREDAERGHKAQVRVTKGKPMAIRIEYFQAKGEAAMHLGYSLPNQSEMRNEALAAAKASDVVVMALGITPSLEGEEMKVEAPGFKGGDRTAIELPKTQRELLAAVRKLGKPVVVVLTGGSAIAIEPGQANAILDQWYSGGRGGDAVAAALFGDYNPAGRLPVTFYRSTKDLPPFESYAMAGRTYRYFRGKPLYPFGFGLSYTEFAYDRPKIEAGVGAGAISSAEGWTITQPVRNIGTRDGDEVVQVYTRTLRPRAGDAVRSLVGFARIPVPRGSSGSAVIRIPRERLRVWDEGRGEYIVRPGAYEFEIGPSSGELPVRVRVNVP